ncbi:MAG: Phosphoprotein phosphatase, partial [Caulobacteraceae bacterium]|nr:Phosphoprotein phosphatase [Caulobacteraceae bacterium]
PATSAPFVARAGDLTLFVVDSADAADLVSSRAGVAAFAGQLDRLGAALDRGDGWLVTHRPIWGLAPVARLAPLAPLQIGINATEQKAVRGRALGGVRMVVSGHVHHFSAISFGPARPAQLVVGTGGDVGEAADTPRVYGGPEFLDGLDATAFSFSRYGYYLMDRDGEDWLGAFHDADDVVRAICRLHERALSCKAP